MVELSNKWESHPLLGLGAVLGLGAFGVLAWTLFRGRSRRRYYRERERQRRAYWGWE